MKTIELIEKRRRELRRINYFLIYLLAMAVFGMFFFIDELTGFFGALKYNIFLRFYFILFVAAFLFYLAQKEQQQARLTADLIEEMHDTSSHLAKEVRQKEFLSEISVLLSNLRDSAVLEQLFSAALKFFQADGGAVVLRDSKGGWKTPLACFPGEIEHSAIAEITNLISHTGRAFIQPDPEFPEHQPIKAVKNAFGVPLRLESRLFGVIAFWSDVNVIHDRSDLGVLEVIAREATNSRFTIEQLQEKSDQFNGLLALLAKAADDQRQLKNRTVKVAEQAKAIARQMELPRETVEAIGVAAMLKDIDKVVKAKGPRANGTSRAPSVLKTFNFPDRVVEVLTGLAGENGRGKKSNGQAAPIGSRILLVADAYIAQTVPVKGRGRSPASVVANLETEVGTRFDEKVVGALRQAVLPAQDNIAVEN